MTNSGTPEAGFWGIASANFRLTRAAQAMRWNEVCADLDVAAAAAMYSLIVTGLNPDLEKHADAEIRLAAVRERYGLSPDELWKVMSMHQPGLADTQDAQPLMWLEDKTDDSF
jgi:hypothetical protein